MADNFGIPWDIGSDIDWTQPAPKYVRTPAFNPPGNIGHVVGANGAWIIGLDATVRRINKLTEKLHTNRQQLYDRVGYGILKWIHYNFDVEGAERPWKPLSPGTLFINKAFGRGPKILQGTGKLRQSFVVRTGGNKITVGSPLKEAAYAQRGTRLHWIEAKPGHRLAFPWQGQKRPSSGQLPSKAQVSTVWQKNKRSSKALPMQKAGATKKAFSQTPYGFFARVRHNRMEPRRILPSTIKTRVLIREVFDQYMKDVEL